MLISELENAINQERATQGFPREFTLTALLPAQDFNQAMQEVNYFMGQAHSYPFKIGGPSGITNFGLRLRGVDCHIVQADIPAACILVTGHTTVLQNAHNAILADADEARIG